MQEMLESIRQGKLQSVYLVHGTEDYLMRMVRQTFLNDVLPIEERELNIATYNMYENSLANAIEEANSYPFLGEYKIVIIDNPYFLTGDKPKQALEQDFSLLEGYLNAPNQETILVIMAPYSNLDNRKKIVKQLKKEATMIDVNPLDEKGTTQFVQHHLQSLAFDIDKKALKLLLDRTHYQLSIIMNELEKLCLYKMHEQKITHHDVQQLVSRTLESNVFLLMEAVQKREADNALTIYRDLILQKEEPIKLLALLLGQIRLFLQVHLLLETGYHQSDITQRLKQHPYRIKLAIEQLRTGRYQQAQLTKLYQTLADTDYRLKTLAMDKYLIMELTLLKMIH